MKLILTGRDDEIEGEVSTEPEVSGPLPDEHKQKIREIIEKTSEHVMDTGPVEGVDPDEAVTPGESVVKDISAAMPRIASHIQTRTPYNVELRRRDEIRATEKSDEWVPYEGPQGGEGWQSTEDETDIRYTEDPPGKVADEYQDMAESWGEDPKRPELDDFTFRGPSSSVTEDFNSVKDEIISVFEEGEIDDGVVNADIRPQNSERWDSVWDLDGENPKVNSPASYGNLYADVQMPVEDFRDLQSHIGNDLNTWDGTFFEEVDERRVQSLMDGLTGEDVEEYYDGVPVPYVEMGSDGSLKSTQEGRHRAVAADRLGFDDIPVKIIIDPDEPGEGFED